MKKIINILAIITLVTLVSCTKKTLAPSDKKDVVFSLKYLKPHNIGVIAFQDYVQTENNTRIKINGVDLKTTNISDNFGLTTSSFTLSLSPSDKLTVEFDSLEYSQGSYGSKFNSSFNLLDVTIDNLTTTDTLKVNITDNDVSIDRFLGECQPYGNEGDKSNWSLHGKTVFTYQISK